jgi:hypothetical protein
MAHGTTNLDSAITTSALAIGTWITGVVLGSEIAANTEGSARITA